MRLFNPKNSELSGDFTMTGPVLLGPVEDISPVPFAYDLEMFYPACPRYYSSVLAWDLWSRVYFPETIEHIFLQPCLKVVL